MYALRFLRASFSLELGTANLELAPAVQNLKAVSQAAAGVDDGAIALVSALLEALLHLKSRGSSCIEDAQRSIAAAKSLQLHPLTQNLTVLWALINCIEIVCCLGQRDCATFGVGDEMR